MCHAYICLDPLATFHTTPAADGDRVRPLANADETATAGALDSAAGRTDDPNAALKSSWDGRRPEIGEDHPRYFDKIAPAPNASALPAVNHTHKSRQTAEHQSWNISGGGLGISRPPVFLGQFPDPESPRFFGPDGLKPHNECLPPRKETSVTYDGHSVPVLDGPGDPVLEDCHSGLKRYDSEILCSYHGVSVPQDITPEEVTARAQDSDMGGYLREDSVPLVHMSGSEGPTSEDRTRLGVDTESGDHVSSVPQRIAPEKLIVGGKDPETAGCLGAVENLPGPSKNQLSEFSASSPDSARRNMARDSRDHDLSNSQDIASGELSVRAKVTETASCSGESCDVEKMSDLSTKNRFPRSSGSTPEDRAGRDAESKYDDHRSAFALKIAAEELSSLKAQDTETAGCPRDVEMQSGLPKNRMKRGSGLTQKDGAILDASTESRGLPVSQNITREEPISESQDREVGGCSTEGSVDADKLSGFSEIRSPQVSVSVFGRQPSSPKVKPETGVGPDVVSRPDPTQISLPSFSQTEATPMPSSVPLVYAQSSPIQQAATRTIGSSPLQISEMAGSEVPMAVTTDAWVQSSQQTEGAEIGVPMAETVNVSVQISPRTVDTGCSPLRDVHAASRSVACSPIQVRTETAANSPVCFAAVGRSVQTDGPWLVVEGRSAAARAYGVGNVGTPPPRRFRSKTAAGAPSPEQNAPVPEERERKRKLSSAGSLSSYATPPGTASEIPLRVSPALKSSEGSTQPHSCDELFNDCSQRSSGVVQQRLTPSYVRRSVPDRASQELVESSYSLESSQLSPKGVDKERCTNSEDDAGDFFNIM